MALMLGPEIMMSDLVPIFDGFLNDLDDVKAGILRHFSEFLRLLPPGQPRESYLGRLAGFIKPDNVRNWRFREDLAHQLTQLCDLYSSESVKRYIVPLTVSLCSDRVAQVRQCSFLLVATIIAKFHNERAIEIANYFRGLLLDRFAKCTMFFGRLTYVQMCEVAMSQPNIDVEMFSQDYLPSLLALHTDNVVNIRIALSRTLNCLYEIRPEFVKHKTNCDWSIDDIVQILVQDLDRDVKHFCLKNTVLFGSSTPLNNSEVFEVDDTNATFVVSQGTETTSSDGINNNDDDDGNNNDSEESSSSESVVMSDSSSNIGRHLQSVLDELNDKETEVEVEKSAADKLSPILDCTSHASTTEVIDGQSTISGKGDNYNLQHTLTNKSFDDEVFVDTFNEQEETSSNSNIDSVSSKAGTTDYDELASEMSKSTLEESAAAAVELTRECSLFQENFSGPQEEQASSQIQSPPSSSNC